MKVTPSPLPPPADLSLLVGFLIPGTSANVSVYLTIIRSEGQNFFIVGQCQLALRDVNPFEENQVHTLVISENIEVSQSVSPTRLFLSPSLPH